MHGGTDNAKTHVVQTSISAGAHRSLTSGVFPVWMPVSPILVMLIFPNANQESDFFSVNRLLSGSPKLWLFLEREDYVRKPVYRKNRFTLFHVLRSSQVIIATTLAETSVTIENIAFVVDASSNRWCITQTLSSCLKRPSFSQAQATSARGGLGGLMRESAIGFTPNTHTGTAVKCMSGAFAV